MTKDSLSAPIPKPVPAMTAPMVVSYPDEEADVLRQRFHEWGYLHLKGVVDRPACDALLEEFCQHLEPHLSLNSDGLAQLNGEPFFETDPVWDHVYPKMQASERFQCFFDRPDLQRVMQTVSDSEVFVYPMKMARISTPRKLGYETPPHQDAHSHHAGPTMAGLWLALHDVSSAMGRLQVLPRSHKRGVRPVHEAQGVGGVQCEIYADEQVWHVSDVEQGDVIIFHSCTVHRAEPNTAQHAARISIDTRFCNYGAPVFVSNIEPHHGWRIEALSWESIYADWENDDRQYYWRDYPNLFSTMRDQVEWQAAAE